jgi:hypothetical protein
MVVAAAVRVRRDVEDGKAAIAILVLLTIGDARGTAAAAAARPKPAEADAWGVAGEKATPMLGVVRVSCYSVGGEVGASDETQNSCAFFGFKKEKTKIILSSFFCTTLTSFRGTFSAKSPPPLF